MSERDSIRERVGEDEIDKKIEGYIKKIHPSIWVDRWIYIYIYKSIVRKMDKNIDR